jgi:signal transduction histidine kinase
MTNITRHAQASKVQLDMISENGFIEIVVKDNGKGISKKQMNDANSIGIINMQERAFLIGGSIEISGSRGKGTTIKATFPLANVEEKSSHD